MMWLNLVLEKWLRVYNSCPHAKSLISFSLSWKTFAKNMWFVWVDVFYRVTRKSIGCKLLELEFSKCVFNFQNNSCSLNSVSKYLLNFSQSEMETPRRSSEQTVNGTVVMLFKLVCCIFLLTLFMYHHFIWCFCCWLWASNYLQSSKFSIFTAIRISSIAS